MKNKGGNMYLSLWVILTYFLWQVDHPIVLAQEDNQSGYQIEILDTHFISKYEAKHRARLYYVGEISGGFIIADCNNKLLFLLRYDPVSVSAQADSIETIDFSPQLKGRTSCLTAVSDRELLIAEAIGGAIYKYSLVSRTILEKIQTPLSSTDSIIAIKNRNDYRIIVTGTYRRQRVHWIGASGRATKSERPDPTFERGRPALSIGGDTNMIYRDKLVYFHPARFQIVLMNLDGTNQDLYSFSGIDEYRDPRNFPVELYPSPEDAKIAFAKWFTPLSGAYMLSDDIVLTCLKIPSEGYIRKDLWQLSQPPRHIMTMNEIEGYVLGVQNGRIISVEILDNGFCIKRLQLISLSPE